jgi:hypothetical protein
MAQPVAVSNTTPLIALAWLERLDLLPTVFGVVHIPEEVQREIAYDPAAPGALVLQQADWLEVTPVGNPLAVELLLDQLDLGESAAIVLAHELGADVLLMDERRGRRRALQSGLRVIGTLGILIEARQRDLIGPLRPELDRLLQLPFRISASLYAEVLARVGES